MTSGRWAKGYTKTEFDDAQEKFGLVFPPDLVVLLRDSHWMDTRGPMKLRSGVCWSRTAQHLAASLIERPLAPHASNRMQRSPTIAR